MIFPLAELLAGEPFYDLATARSSFELIGVST